LHPAWQWLYFLDTPSASSTGTDGHPKTGNFLPPVPLPRRMWAAGDFEIRHPIFLGTPATKRSAIASVELKEGSTGPLVFVTVKHTIEQSGVVCIDETQRIVYREKPPGPSPLPPGKELMSSYDWSVEIQPDPVMLFRFSALTYNSHRIHYDRQYAVEEECYPGLVVHGPLQVTILNNCIRQFCDGAAVTEFSFRAQRPLFDMDPFTVCLKRSGNQISAWTRSHEGFVGMSAAAVIEYG